MSNYGKLTSAEPLRSSIERNMDIEFFLHGKRYFCGPTWKHERAFCECPDGDAIPLDSAEDEMNHIIDGKPLIEQWADMEIISM